MLIKYKILHRPICFMLLLISFFSCKKTNEYAQEVNDTPYLVTGYINLETIGKGSYAGFSRSYLLGDTMTLVGRFFVDKPGSLIRLGNQTIQPLEKYKLSNGINSYTQQTEYLDVIRFVITKEMGLGSHISLSITGNGKTLRAPDISIRQFSGSMQQTDTTLYVAQLANWKPDDLAFYQQHSLPMVTNCSVTAEGDVYFGNYSVINAVHEGKITKLLKANDQFTENGSTFTIKSIAGNVVSYDGSRLTFSVEVTEGIPEEATSYIFRLCNMNLATRQVTTINRTLVTKEAASQNEKAGPFEGAIGSLKIVASRLKADANGMVYFLNSYSPARTDHINSQWYINGLWPTNPESDPALYNNICRLDPGGAVKSLFTQNDVWAGPSLYAIPGTPIQMTFDYVISPDGKTFFCNNQVSFNIAYSFGSFDLEQGESQYSTGFYQPTYSFFSYDTSSVNGYHEKEFSPVFFLGNTNYLSNFLYTANGELLQQQNASIGAINLPNKTIYCYAGTEIGLVSSNSTQTQLTGPARNVLFPEYIWLIGVDKQGSVLYTRSMNDYTSGVSFYRMYSRK